MADGGNPPRNRPRVPVARLGELERAVMEALWDLTEPAASVQERQGPSPPATATARQVAERLAGRSLAYTTVLTVLARLERKGMVRHLREGRTHTYTPVASREDYAAELMLEALGAAGDRSRGAVLARFGDAVAGLPEAEALRQALQETLQDREEGGR
jgi:predicted transcriptional regulator